MTLRNAFGNLALDATVAAVRDAINGLISGGRLKTDGSGVTQPVNDAGGSLTVDDGGGSLTVDGTVGISGTVPVSASSLPLPTGAATSAAQGTANASLSSIDTKLSGAATEATLAQVRDAVKAQIDIASTLWTDNSGAYYVRRDLVSEGTGQITVTFTDPSGAAATPGAGLRPLSTVDRDVTQALFDAIGSGTGYSIGDLLARILVIETSNTPVLTTALWVNLSTGLAIGAPTAGTVEPSEESIGARQVGTWTVSGPLTDSQLRASAVPMAPNITRGSGSVDANTQRVVLASDGPTVTALQNIDGKTAALINGRSGVEPLGQPGVARQLAAGSASANTALTSTCRRISVAARSADIRFLIGSTSQTASATSHYIANGERLDLSVPSTPNIAVIRAGSTDGTLEVMELL